MKKHFMYRLHAGPLQAGNIVDGFYSNRKRHYKKMNKQLLAALPSEGLAGSAGAGSAGH